MGATHQRPGRGAERRVTMQCPRPSPDLRTERASSGHPSTNVHGETQQMQTLLDPDGFPNRPAPD